MIEEINNVTRLAVENTLNVFGWFVTFIILIFMIIVAVFIVDSILKKWVK